MQAGLGLVAGLAGLGAGNLREQSRVACAVALESAMHRTDMYAGQQAVFKRTYTDAEAAALEGKERDRYVQKQGRVEFYAASAHARRVKQMT